jgi:hypothetical protein
MLLRHPSKTFNHLVGVVAQVHHVKWLFRWRVKLYIFLFHGIWHRNFERRGRRRLAVDPPCVWQESAAADLPHVRQEGAELNPPCVRQEGTDVDPPRVQRKNLVLQGCTLASSEDQTCLQKLAGTFVVASSEEDLTPFHLSCHHLIPSARNFSN